MYTKRWLSVIIPCYNVRNYLEKCINNIFEANLTDVEIIFVDDGSTDLSGGIAEYFGFQSADTYIKFDYRDATVIIISQENKGVSAARNTGIKAASGEYILFMDPDDYILNDWINTVTPVILLEYPDFDLFGFKNTIVDAEGNIVTEWTSTPIENYDIHSNDECMNLLFPRFLGYSVSNIRRWASGEKLPQQLEFGGVWRNIYKREFLVNNQIYFSDAIRVNEDSMFNARCCLYANRVVARSDVYYCYIRRPSGALVKGMQVKKNAANFIDNKIQLAHERRELIQQAYNKGYKYTIYDMVGSCVMSALECVIKCPYNSWNDVKNYLEDDTVRESIKEMPFVGIKKFDFPLFALKWNMKYPLFIFVKAIEKLGFEISI